jgi:outer membrane autotransporter protein
VSTPTPTLVASLLPFAAVSSAIPAKSAGPAPRLGLFINGHAAFGEKDPTKQESGFDYTSAGVTAGMDYRVTNNFVFGIALNYQATDQDLDRTQTVTQSTITSVPGGSVDTQNFNVSLYGTYYVQKFYIDSILTWGWGDYDIRRVIQYDNRANGTSETVPVNQVATADTESHQFAFSFGMGYDFTQGSLTAGPYARINYFMINIDRYQESIDNTDPGFGWAMAFHGQEADSLISVVGAQASYAISTSFGVVLPQIRLEWNHEFLNERRDILASFVADPVRQPIALRTDGPDTDFIILGAGVAVSLPHGWSAFGDYETIQALSNFSRHAFTIGVRKDL